MTAALAGREDSEFFEDGAATPGPDTGLDELALLYESGRLIGQTLDLAVIYDAFQSTIARAMDCDSLLVSEYTPDDNLIRCRYGWIEGQRADISGFPALELAPVGQGLQSTVIHTGEPVLVNDFSEHRKQHRALYYTDADGTVSPEPSKPTTQSLLMVPIRLEGHVLGVVQVQSLRKGAYTPAHLQLLEAMTLQVAAASRNAYLYQQAREEISERQRFEAENARLLREVEEAAQRQRTFLCEVLFSVTGGKLRLCNTEADLPFAPPLAAEPLVLASSADMRRLRHLAQETAQASGFSEERWRTLGMAVGEATMNALVHAGGGIGYLRLRKAGGTIETIQVRVEDRGTGIAVETLPRATLEKGYTTAGSLGHGFKLILETVDRVWLLTGPTGTTVVLEQDRTEPADPLLSADWPGLSS